MHVPSVSISSTVSAPPRPQRYIPFSVSTSTSTISSLPAIRDHTQVVHNVPNHQPNTQVSQMNIATQNSVGNVNYSRNTPIQPTTVPSLSVAPASTPFKWYYLTRFQPYETQQNIVSFIVSKTNCDPSLISCHKLVRSNRDENIPLTFVSFKISVPAEIEAFITAPHFWPVGVSIKPFAVRNESSSQHFLSTRQSRIALNMPSPRQRATLQTNYRQIISPLASPLPLSHRVVHQPFLYHQQAGRSTSQLTTMV